MAEENKTIQLTEEQFQELINQKKQTNQIEEKEDKPNFLVKTVNKTKNGLDTSTRGMDGSIFSIARWLGKMFIEMVDGIRQYIKTQQTRRQNKD